MLGEGVAGESGRRWEAAGLILSEAGWLVRRGERSILESRLLPDLGLIISRGFCFKAGFGQHVYECPPIPLLPPFASRI